METILNDKSKAYERITLDMLLSYIKTNLSTLQPNSSVITVDKKENSETKTKVSKVNKINTESFYDDLNNSVSKIKFNSDFIKTFITNTEINNINDALYVLNYNNIISVSVENSEASETNKKKVDYTHFSFFKSVLYALINKPTETDLEIFIKTLVKHVMYGGITEFGYNKLKWNKKPLKDNINNNVIDAATIRVVSDYLHVNIFVINEDAKQIEYGGAEFIPFKKNIFLYKYKNNFYPVFTKDCKFFKFTSPLVKYLLTNTQKITLLSHDQMTFKEEDLSKYINLATIMPEIPVNIKAEEMSVINKFDEDFTEFDDGKNNSQNVIESESESNSESESDNESEDNSEIFEKYMKLSLMEIQKEAKKLNINIKDNNNKLKNKNILCMEITKLKNN